MAHELADLKNRALPAFVGAVPTLCADASGDKGSGATPSENVIQGTWPR